MKKVDHVKKIYFAEFTLQEGFDLLKVEREERLFRGKYISRCSGFDLWRKFEGTGQIKCWRCNAVADRWIADRGKNESANKPPVANLYGYVKGRLRMFSQDHIIPKSMGGTDATENMRPACEDCNTDRKNHMSDEEIAFKVANPHLWDEDRFVRGYRLAITKDHTNALPTFAKLALTVPPEVMAKIKLPHLVDKADSSAATPPSSAQTPP